MKLGVYIPLIEEKPGGLGTYTREVTARLIEKVDDLVLFTTTPDTVPASWDVEVVGMPADARGARLGRVAQRFAWLNWDVRNEVARRGLDALFVPTHEGMVACPVPQTVVVHDLTMLVMPSHYFNPLLQAYMRFMLPIVLKTSAKTIAVSENTKRDIASILGLSADEIEVVTEGYDESIFRARGEDECREVKARFGLEKPYLLYSGTFAPHKNTPFLAEVLAEVRERGHDIELAFTGRLDVGEFAETRRRLEARDLWQHTRALGYVSYDDLAMLMQASHAFVFPSLYEGFGLAPLEAMASGAPVVVSDRASLPEVVGDLRYLAAPTDASAWADIIESLLSDEASRVARDAVLTRARGFSWDDAVSRILTAIGRSTSS